MKKGQKLIYRKKADFVKVKRHKEVFLKNYEEIHKVWHRNKVVFCHNPLCRKKLSFYNPNIYCFVCVHLWIIPELRPILRPYSMPIKRKYGGYIKRWCKSSGCKNKYYAKGYCENCYHRIIVHGGR